MEDFSIENISEIANLFLDKILSYLPSVIAALVILILGFWVIKLIVGRVRKVMEKREVDPGVRGLQLVF